MEAEEGYSTNCYVGMQTIQCRATNWSDEKGRLEIDDDGEQNTQGQCGNDDNVAWESLHAAKNLVH